VCARRFGGEQPPETPQIKGALTPRERGLRRGGRGGGGRRNDRKTTGAWRGRPPKKGRTGIRRPGVRGLAAFFSGGSLCADRAPVVPPGGFGLRKRFGRGDLRRGGQGGEAREGRRKDLEALSTKECDVPSGQSSGSPIKESLREAGLANQRLHVCPMDGDCASRGAGPFCRRGAVTVRSAG